jgi:UDP-GlcNAc:undecaprenyl-phosphate/decaprenyl-phosphate GlcNAc-1-phosphate transferase
MAGYLIVFGVSAAVAFLMTPLVRRLAIRTGWIDHPSDRKVHPTSTPTAGGLAIMLGVLAGLAVSRAVPSLSPLFKSSSDPDAALLAALAIVAIGLWDDMRGLSALGKLSGQILSAGLLVLAGVQLLYFWFPGQGILVLSPDLAVPLTVLWVLGMVNAVNLIDGLDGLAAGIVAIAAVSFFVYMYLSPGLFAPESPAALLCAITAGAAVGFLPWNFHPARIFMGDSGAMLLGLMLAAATISGVGRNPYPPTGGDLAAFAIPVAVPLFVLAIPILDVTLAVLRRIRAHRKLSAPDKEHLHHQLMDLGHSQRQAVLLLYLWSALISGCALAVALIDGRSEVVAILAGAFGIFLISSIPRLRKARERARLRRTGENAPVPADVAASSTTAEEIAAARGGGTAVAETTHVDRHLRVVPDPSEEKPA